LAKVALRLAEIPKFAYEEYRLDQVKFYAKFTEMAYKALNLSSIQSFIDELTERLKIEGVEVRVMRPPSPRSRIVGINLASDALKPSSEAFARPLHEEGPLARLVAGMAKH